MWWKNIRQGKYFIMQEHKVGLPVWPYKYRITLRENRMEIANSNDPEEIEMDWGYLMEHVVPQADKKIDIGESVSNVDWVALINLVVKKI